MKGLSAWLRLLIAATAVGWTSWATAQNQTATLSPILSSNAVPFSIQIEPAGFSLPSGLQSFVTGTSSGKWLLLAGRINGLHGFDNTSSNFPPNTQNTTVFVVDPTSQTVTTRSLTNQESGLTQAQIDLLSVTAAQSYQSRNTLYISGGYGIDTATTNFTTKAALTAIDVPGLIHWVASPTNGETAAQYIRQIFDPMFQITGGVMMEASRRHALLVFGQDFEGAVGPSSNGTYSEQIRRFRIIDRGTRLSAVAQKTQPKSPDPNYRRASLNVVPIIERGRQRFVAFSGAFTLTDGIWTIPVEIGRNGTSRMANPTIRCDRNGAFSQYLMNAGYPVILSTGSNPGNQLLFGAGATLIPVVGLRTYKNGVLKYDRLGSDPLWSVTSSGASKAPCPIPTSAPTPPRRLTSSR